MIENIGGIFIYANDANKLRDWYRDNLQLNYETNEEYGVHWSEFWYIDSESKKRYTLFTVSQAKSELTSEKKYTINFRVKSMETALSHLKSKGIELKGPETYPEGIFAWVVDPEGNQVELWEDIKAE